MINRRGSEETLDARFDIRSPTTYMSSVLLENATTDATGSPSTYRCSFSTGDDSWMADLMRWAEAMIRRQDSM